MQIMNFHKIFLFCQIMTSFVDATIVSLWHRCEVIKFRNVYTNFPKPTIIFRREPKIVQSFPGIFKCFYNLKKMNELVKSVAFFST